MDPTKLKILDELIEKVHQLREELKETSGKNPAKQNSRIVTLNVGGAKFVTTLETLQAPTSAFFSAMFSGNFKSVDVDGGCFIDRDPTYFPVILSFLRSNKFPELATKQEIAGVLDEAQFYGIVNLAIHLKLALLDLGKTVTYKNESVIAHWKFDALPLINGYDDVTMKVNFGDEECSFSFYTEEKKEDEIHYLQTTIFTPESFLSTKLDYSIAILSQYDDDQLFASGTFDGDGVSHIMSTMADFCDEMKGFVVKGVAIARLEMKPHNKPKKKQENEGGIQEQEMQV